MSPCAKYASTDDAPRTSMGARLDGCDELPAPADEQERAAATAVWSEFVSSSGAVSAGAVSVDASMAERFNDAGDSIRLEAEAGNELPAGTYPGDRRGVIDNVVPAAGEALHKAPRLAAGGLALLLLLVLLLQVAADSCACSCRLASRARCCAACGAASAARGCSAFAASTGIQQSRGPVEARPGAV
jgi:hypothetical protein